MCIRKKVYLKLVIKVRITISNTRCGVCILMSWLLRPYPLIKNNIPFILRVSERGKNEIWFVSTKISHSTDIYSLILLQCERQQRIFTFSHPNKVSCSLSFSFFFVTQLENYIVERDTLKTQLRAAAKSEKGRFLRDSK